jgi:hypothetical protein
LTGGNYRLRRSISYPDYPASKIETDAQVTSSTQGEWVTTISINGTYDGPTDVISVRDYEQTWSRDSTGIIESGSATLALRSGQTVRQVWTSTIAPRDGLTEFPQTGESISISVAPFQIAGDSMSYRWEGTVRVRRD